MKKVHSRLTGSIKRSATSEPVLHVDSKATAKSLSQAKKLILEKFEASDYDSHFLVDMRIDGVIFNPFEDLKKRVPAIVAKDKDPMAELEDAVQVA